MIDYNKLSMVQYSIGNQGLRRYKTYSASNVISSGTYPSNDLGYIKVTVYQDDNTTNRFKDYCYATYGNFSGGPNDSAKTYEAKFYSKSALYREVPAGPIYNYILDISAETGEGRGFDFNGLFINTYTTGPSTINDTTTFIYDVHILYNPFRPGDFDV